MKKLLSLAILFAIVFYSHGSIAERVQGPGLITTSLPPKEKQYFKILLKEDKVARFIGIGDGGIVDYFAYDPNGTLIASDTEPNNNCNIEFVPKLPGYHFFMVKNYGDSISEIVVRTN